MATSEIVKIQGFTELMDDLKKIPIELRTKAIAKSVRAGAKVVVKAARQKAPVRSNEWEGINYPNPPGTLKKGIKAEKAKRQPSYIYRDVIGFSPKAWYGALVERGHKIVRGDKTIGHVAAKPFLRPAFDDNQDKIFEAMREKLGEEIDKFKMGIIRVK